MLLRRLKSPVSSRALSTPKDGREEGGREEGKKGERQSKKGEREMKKEEREKTGRKRAGPLPWGCEPGGQQTGWRWQRSSSTKLTLKVTSGVLGEHLVFVRKGPGPVLLPRPVTASDPDCS